MRDRQIQPPLIPGRTSGPWRMVGEARRITYSYEGEEHSVTIRPLQDSTVAEVWSIQVDTQAAENVSCIFGNDDLILLRQGAKQLRTYVQHVEGEIQVFLHGQMYRLARRQPPNVRLRSTNRGEHYRSFTESTPPHLWQAQLSKFRSMMARQCSSASYSPSSAP